MGYTIGVVLLKALTQYLANDLVSKSIAETRIWQLCGHFTISENINVTEMVNYAEQVDSVMIGENRSRHNNLKIART